MKNAAKPAANVWAICARSSRRAGAVTSRAARTARNIRARKGHDQEVRICRGWKDRD